MDTIEDAKRRYEHNHFMEVLIVGCWSIWLERNKHIIEHVQLNINSCVEPFKVSFTLIMHIARPSLREGMQSWLDSL